MQNVLLTLPTFGLAVITRAALGAGVGLMLADRIEPRRRRTIGAGLIAFGVATTIPVVRAVVRGKHEAERL